MAALGLIALLLPALAPRDIILRSAALAADGNSFTLTAPLPLPLLPIVMIESGSLSLAPAAGDAAAGGAGPMALLGGGQARLVLEDATLSVAATQSSDPLMPKDMQALAPVLAALVKLSFSRLELRRGTVRIGRGAEQPEMLTDVSFDVILARAGEAQAKGSFLYRGHQVSLDVVISTAAELREGHKTAEPMIGRNLDLIVTSDLFSLVAKGILSAGNQPNFSAETSKVSVTDLRQIAEWMGVTWSTGRGPAKFEATGPLEFSAERMAFADATVNIDENAATGAMTLTFNPGKPALDATLAFETLDISRYVEQAKPAAGPTTPATDIAGYLNRNAAEPPFPLLSQLDADLRISAGKVNAGIATFGRGAASLSLKNGILLADLAELEVGKGGRSTGQLSVEVKGGKPYYTLRAKTETIDLATISQALWAYPVLSGFGDITLDLGANGETARQIISSLHGKAGVRQPEAGQIGLDLKTLAATARADVQVGWGGAMRGQTAIKALDARFSLSDGHMTIDAVSARAGDASLSAEGGVSFPERLGDVKIWITHPGTATGTAAGNTSGEAAAADPARVAASAAPANGETPARAAAVPPAGAAAPGDAKNPGGGLHMQGPLDTPEIRFLPLSRRPPAATTPAAPGRG